MFKFKINIKLILLFLTLLIINTTVSATNYQLPSNGGRLIGKNKTIVIPKDNTRPLEYFAAKYQLGLSNMLEANPGVDPYLPKGGTILNIPQQLILPDTVHEGIIINSAEMRLYFYLKDSNIVVVLPIGIGQLGNGTPENWITKVERKKIFPYWIPTDKIRAEYASIGKLLPVVVPAGPDNPMGFYALYVGNSYAIHGTNTDFGIGLRISHGCVRLRNDDVKFLFENVSIGTRVQFINEPVKITAEPNGRCYIEIHNPLSTKEREINNNEIVPIRLNSTISTFIKQKSINTNIVQQEFKNRSGIPVCINCF